MNRMFLPVLALALALVPLAAQAHFVWIAVKTADGKSTAHAWFAESAEPGEADLIEKINKFEFKAADGEKTFKLAHEVKKTGDYAALVAPLPGVPTALTGWIDYGVLKKGESPAFRLQYFARYADAAAAFEPGPEKPALDVQPRLAAGEVAVVVLVDGKPGADLEVVSQSAAGEELKTKTDASGIAKLGQSQPGLWSIRAKQVVAQAGEVAGQSFADTRRYATLTLRVPGTPAIKVEAKPEGKPAETKPDVKPDANAKKAGVELLKSARAGRAAWHNFPGFTSKLTLKTGDTKTEGTLSVAADGKVTLTGFGEKPDELRGVLRSLVMHRMPGNEVGDEGLLVAEKGEHPLGPLVKLDYDTQMASAYRVQDGVITQVNRSMDGGKFTISVINVERNKEGKYLPGTYTVSFWNADGSLRSSTTVQEQYVRVGSLDLPARRLSVTAGKDKLDYQELIFSEQKLMQ